MLVFSVIGYVLVRTQLPGRSILDSICWLPSAIPGVLSGLGLLWMFLGTPFFRPFYGTIVLLVVASVLGGITLSTQILKANFIQLSQELEEASRMSGAGFCRTYFRVIFPLMAQTMVLVGVVKFMFAAQHPSSIILLATSETRPLSLLALDQIAAGYREVASITVILITLLTVGLAVMPDRLDSKSASGRINDEANKRNGGRESRMEHRRSQSSIFDPQSSFATALLYAACLGQST